MRKTYSSGITSSLSSSTNLTPRLAIGASVPGVTVMVSPVVGVAGEIGLGLC